jgi:hypothetical protein
LSVDQQIIIGNNMETGIEVARLIGRKLNDTMLHTLTILTVLRLLSDGKNFKINCLICILEITFSSNLFERS